MSNSATYIDYFRNLAASHHLIQHDPASETADSDIGKKKFTIFGNEEIVAGLSSKLSFPGLCIEMFETTLKAETPYDIKQNPKGSFMVLGTAKVNDFVDRQLIYDLTEEITYDLLQKIWDDHYGEGKERCKTPFKQFYYNQAEIMPVGPLFKHEFGWYVPFSFVFQDTIKINQPPAAGKFI